MTVVWRDGTFVGDDDQVADMFFDDFDEINDLRELESWVKSAAAGRRKKKQVSNELVLRVDPRAQRAWIEGRWEDWGTASFEIEDFVEACRGVASHRDAGL